MPKVTIKTDKKSYELPAENGQNLLELLRKSNIEVDSACNGNGTCGKCKVKISSGMLPAASQNEMKILGIKAVEEGYRLSCGCKVEADMEIILGDTGAQAQIVVEGRQRKITLSPLVTKEVLTLEKPSLSDQTADFERVLGGLEADGSSLELIRVLPGMIRQNNYMITLIKSGNRLLGAEASNTAKTLYGVAVDIGTTTAAVYLLDMNSSKRVGVHSFLNPQKTFGADVISRIKHTNDNDKGLEELHLLITGKLNDCIKELCQEAGISNKDVYAVTFAGNTTMIHFLLKVPAKNIAAAPFIPAVTSMLKINAKELNFDIDPFGIACILPSVSAYIGADTVGAVLSTGMYRQAEISLMIDIGTNGEIVLGNRDVLYACSSAAGPAFEGANIRNGMGSVSGAINSITLEAGVRYTTIGNARPVGICGTGIVDGVAQLLKAGIIDETGRLDTGWEPDSEQLAGLAENITTIEGMNVFVLEGDIAISQKDIRELQNAKAAIAAGIHILVGQAGISFQDIKNVYLAGGFGTYINIGSAIRIGLIPAELQGKIQSVGNAAGQGAIEALLSSESLSDAVDISKKIRYIELSASKEFNDCYVNCMMFE